MSIDLNAAGAKVIGGTGGGTSFGDPLIQTIQVSQTTLGAVPVSETNLESATGTTADPSWVGSGVASIIAVLKAIALRLGVGAAVQDGSGAISVGGTAQNLFSSLTPTNGFWVQNTSSATLYVNDVGGAAAPGGSSFTIQAGANLVTPPGYKPSGAVSIYGVNSGQTFAARRW